jgi:leucyl aminopeptidase
MKIAFAAKPQKDTDLYLLAVTHEDLKKIKGPHAGLVRMLVDAYPEFAGDPGDVVTTVLPDYKYKRFGLMGLGAAKGRSPLFCEKTGGRLMSALISIPANDVFVELGDVSADEAGLVAAGAALRAYEFRKYLTKQQDQFLSDSVTLSSPAPAVSNKLFQAAEHARKAVHWARDMANEPPNILHPTSFAAAVIKEAKRLKIKTTLFDDKALRKMGAGGIIAVGQASEHAPCMVILEYNGTGKKNSTPVALVGKGVTFDTGGYSIKTVDGMNDMKTDMAGAAAVAGTVYALAAAKAKVHVVAALAIVENMVSDEAFRPGDILTMLSGMTVEVTNTDAEGRLILADAMWHVQTVYKPKIILDIATLTGAALVALGEEYAAYFSNDDGIAKGLEAASFITDDKVWRMPLDKAYDAQMDSNIADMRNLSATRWGGTCTAAAFIKRFVKPGVKWIHVDMAPTMMTRSEQALCPGGCTGFGVRLLSRWIADMQ